MSERKRSVELFFGRDGKKKTCSMSGCYGGVVAICVTMAIVWTVGPIAVYNSPRGTAVSILCLIQLPLQLGVARLPRSNSRSTLYLYDF